MDDWIPCDRRIPPEAGWYDVIAKRTGRVYRAYNHGVDPQWYLAGTVSAPPGEITHWRRSAMRDASKPAPRDAPRRRWQEWFDAAKSPADPAAGG